MTDQYVLSPWKGLSALRALREMPALTGETGMTDVLLCHSVGVSLLCCNPREMLLIMEWGAAHPYEAGSMTEATHKLLVGNRGFSVVKDGDLFCCWATLAYLHAKFYEVTRSQRIRPLNVRAVGKDLRLFLTHEKAIPFAVVIPFD